MIDRNAEINGFQIRCVAWSVLTFAIIGGILAYSELLAGLVLGGTFGMIAGLVSSRVLYGILKHERGLWGFCYDHKWKLIVVAFQACIWIPNLITDSFPAEAALGISVLSLFVILPFAVFENYRVNSQENGLIDAIGNLLWYQGYRKRRFFRRKSK